jgi:hypothetical protein
MAASRLTMAQLRDLGSPLSEKLTRENYLFWSAQTMPWLHGTLILSSLDGTDVAPPCTIDTEDTNQKPITMRNPFCEAWLAHDQHVLGVLTRSTCKELLAQVLGLEHTALRSGPCSKAWSHLPPGPGPNSITFVVLFKTTRNLISWSTSTSADEGT